MPSPSSEVSGRWALEVIGRSHKSRPVPIERFPFTIGRDPDNDLALPCTSVSRRHAAIEKDGDELCVIDRQSRNHVFLNGRQVARSAIRAGDRLRVGKVDLLVSRPGEVRIPAASPQAGTVFYPREESWDPIHTLSSVLSSAGIRERTAPRGPDWQKVLELSLEPGVAGAYETVLDAVEDSVAFDRCLLLLFEEGYPDGVRVLARRSGARHDDARNGGAGSELCVSKEILRRVAEKREAVLVSPGDAQVIARQSWVLSGASTALCLPLVVRNKAIGVLYLDRSSAARPLVREDLETLGPLSGILALKIDNRRLMEAHLAAQLARRELEIAESIQRSLYPKENARISGYSVEGFTRPCHQVGGDYFDFIPNGDAELVWVLGDVSGKGIPSALYMVSVLATLRAHLKVGLGLPDVMRNVAEHVEETFRPDYFLTLCAGRLDAATGALTYSNAGHLPPVILRRDGAITELEATDPALNIVPCARFAQLEQQLEPGDLLVAYTDGITECEGRDGDRFGSERLISFLREQRDLDLVELRKRLLAKLDEFSRDDGPHDDLTVLLIRRDIA